MYLFHGSPANFTKLKISKNLVNSANSSEGLGIYFSTERDVAESYGRYIYILKTDNHCMKDYRNAGTCKNFVKKIVKFIYSQTGVDIEKFISVDTIVLYMTHQRISICGVFRELYMLLDNNEFFYKFVPEKPRERVLFLLRSEVIQKREFKNDLDVYMFPIHIRGCGVIKDVSKAEIVDKIDLHKGR